MRRRIFARPDAHVCKRKCSATYGHKQPVFESRPEVFGRVVPVDDRKAVRFETESLASGEQINTATSEIDTSVTGSSCPGLTGRWLVSKGSGAGDAPSVVSRSLQRAMTSLSSASLRRPFARTRRRAAEHPLPSTTIFGPRKNCLEDRSRSRLCQELFPGGDALEIEIHRQGKLVRGAHPRRRPPTRATRPAQQAFERGQGGLRLRRVAWRPSSDAGRYFHSGARGRPDRYPASLRPPGRDPETKIQLL